MIIKSVYKGIVASVLLLGMYFLIISSISGWNFAQLQFFLNWYWIVGLIIGFGVQVCLFTYLRALHRERMSGAVTATTGTVSGLSMVACCAHYLVNILPFVGISALAAVVGQYQQELFLIGAASNAAGIAYMVKQLLNIRKNNDE